MGDVYTAERIGLIVVKIKTQVAFAVSYALVEIDCNAFCVAVKHNQDGIVHGIDQRFDFCAAFYFGIGHRILELMQAQKGRKRFMRVVTESFVLNHRKFSPVLAGFALHGHAQ